MRVSIQGARPLFYVGTLFLAVFVGRDFTLGCRPLQPDSLFAGGYLNGSSSAVFLACLLTPFLFALSSYLVWWRRHRRVAAGVALAWAGWVLALTYLLIVSTNVWFDRSPAEYRASRILSASEEYHSGGRGHVGDTTAYLVFQSWRGPGSEVLEVSSRPSYLDHTPTELELWVHRGLWRLAWVERCRFKPLSPVANEEDRTRCELPGSRFLPFW